jgi:hypothetical protein
MAVVLRRVDDRRAALAVDRHGVLLIRSVTGSPPTRRARHALMPIWRNARPKSSLEAISAVMAVVTAKSE